MDKHLLFLDISGGELLIIILAAFLLFGPSKLPEISRKLGKTMGELKKNTMDIKDRIQDELDNSTNSAKPQERDKEQENNKFNE